MENLKSELLKFAQDHFFHFGFYPKEFEFKNKVYNQEFILKTIKESKPKLNDLLKSNLSLEEIDEIIDFELWGDLSK